MRDRLIELICDKIQDGHCIGYCNHPPCSQCKDIADHLLANGVIVQKQGEWVSAPIKEKGYDSKTIPTCSNCGYQSFITYTFCPDCGAKLKERENNA